MSPRNPSDEKGTPGCIVFFWIVFGFGLLIVLAAILLGGYQ